MERASELGTPTRGIRASEVVAHALKALIAKEGEARATEIMGLSRPTIGRLVGCLGVQPATLIVAAQKLGVRLTGAIADEPDPADEASRS